MLKYFYYREVYFLFIKSKLSLFFRENYFKTKFEPYKNNFKDKYGIEIGGPSFLLSTPLMPIYQLAKKIDGCNFSNNTVWEGAIYSQEYNYFKEKKGKQFISEGSDLSQIPNEQYDFVLSCHNLEHIANPLKALKEWYRILKKGGTILLVLPDKRFTFDRKREYTSLSHIIKDYDENIDDTDLTHLKEILSLHDLSLDPGAGRNFDSFKKRCENNVEIRCMHHHVYSQEVLNEMFAYINIKTVSQYFIPPIHQVIIGVK